MFTKVLNRMWMLSIKNFFKSTKGNWKEYFKISFMNLGRKILSMNPEFSGLEGTRKDFKWSQICCMIIENKITIEIIKSLLIHDIITGHN